MNEFPQAAAVDPAPKAPTKGRARSGAWRAGAVLLRVALPLLVLWFGVRLGGHLLDSAPEAERGEGGPRAGRLVDVKVLRAGNHALEVRAMGAVMPAREVALQAEVAGRIVEMNPLVVPGGLLSEGEWIVRLDRRDFELEVRQRRAAVDMARGRYDLEAGQQVTARQELELIGEVLEEEEARLVLRQPQLEAARAELDAAEAALAAAELALARTEVHAPFNGVVLVREVEVGSQISSSTPLVRLAGTDAAWVELAIPTDALRWVQLPRGGTAGSRVRLRDDSAWEAGVFREGRVVQMLGELSEAARMARVLVEVGDPLALDAESGPPLLFRGFLSGVVEGPEVENVFEVSRRFLREGDRLWIMNDEDRLEIRTVGVLFRGEENLLIDSGVKDGERLVLTSLRSPVEGMLLRAVEGGVVLPLAGEGGGAAGAANPGQGGPRS